MMLGNLEGLWSAGDPPERACTAEVPAVGVPNHLRIIEAVWYHIRCMVTSTACWEKADVPIIRR